MSWWLQYFNWELQSADAEYKFKNWLFWIRKNSKNHLKSVWINSIIKYTNISPFLQMITFDRLRSEISDTISCRITSRFKKVQLIDWNSQRWWAAKVNRKSTNKWVNLKIVRVIWEILWDSLMSINEYHQLKTNRRTNQFEVLKVV